MMNYQTLKEKYTKLANESKYPDCVGYASAQEMLKTFGVSVTMLEEMAKTKLEKQIAWDANGRVAQIYQEFVSDIAAYKQWYLDMD